MAWTDKPYKGGGPAKVNGFPRPLYPPDVPEASGYEPSSRGPDVVAYKRTICRLGRWGDWDPDVWDDGYWTNFAHGKENGGRAWSGVEGVQYQQHLDKTGWLGKKTFDALRYALVPNDPAFPHAGEQAMDNVACNLINEAYDMFAGHEPPPTSSAPSKTVRLLALDRAKGQLGYKESPSGSNQNKYGDWYGMNYQPWCAMFCTWAYELAANEAGKDSPSFKKGSRYSYVPYVVGDARNKNNGLKTVDVAAVWPGDLVCYDWSWDSEHDHIGIFEKWVGPSTFYCIEGNTSNSNNSNGGEVMRRTRTVGEQGTVFVRVAEP